MRADDNSRLDLLIKAADQSGLPLDFWAVLTEGLDSTSLALLAERAPVFPLYIQSRE